MKRNCIKILPGAGASQESRRGQLLDTLVVHFESTEVSKLIIALSVGHCQQLLSLELVVEHGNGVGSLIQPRQSMSVLGGSV